MASKNNTTKKNTSSKRSTNKKSTYNAKKQKEDLKQNGAMQDEIILIIALVVSILLFLSNFDLSGVAGKHVSDFLFGMIGSLTYVLPFITFFGTAFYISNLGNQAAGRKILSGVVFLVTLTAFIQLLSVTYNSNTKIFQYYIDSSKDRVGGGLIGGILVIILCEIFDVTATYIILIAMMLISIIVITGKAIILYFAKMSKHSLEDRRKYRLQRKAQMEQMELDEQSSPRGIKSSANRKWKTFELETDEMNNAKNQPNKSNVVSLKERKLTKKAQDEMDELPIVNLDHLFPKDKQTSNLTSNTSPSDIKVTGIDQVPTYEDELRDKFGKAQSNNIIDINTSDQSKAISPDTTEVLQMKSIDEADTNKSIQKTNSKDIENLNINQLAQEKTYIFPTPKLLSPPKPKGNKGLMTERSLKETALKLQSTLESFGVHVTITNVSCGPSVTRYELQPEHGVKVKSITSLADDIKLNLAASDVRIEAPIPGKSAVGIEVPNKENSVVTFRELIESKEFTDHPSDIAFAVGRDIGGQVIITDIAKMPHLLIAGATGSGKSVCINTLIMSILYKSSPSDVRMIMIDPKVVELNAYNGIPHLLIPVVTDPKKASAALNWAVMEMTDRYKKFAETGSRDLKGYNEKVQAIEDLNDENYQKLPQIVIIIDELADLMMVAPGEVEDSICRLAQMARAAGIHLIIATQRPSVNVITGLIKANIPSRIAFAVSSAIDSRTIIDGSGAEKLLGKGDMLFFPSGYPKPVRIQGSYVSDKEVGSVVEYVIKNNSEASYSEEIKESIANVKAAEAAQAVLDERDDYFIEAGRFIIEKDKASIGMLQRVYKIGFNRAARIMDQLAEAGVVGPEEGTKPRKILMSAEEYEQSIDGEEIS